MSLVLDIADRNNSSSPKNALIALLDVSDNTSLVVPGMGEDQRDRAPLILDTTNGQRLDPSINPVYAMERETSSPKNALIISLMGDNQTFLGMGLLAVDSTPTIAVLHARRDVQGNARSDQKQRGGTA